MLDNNQLIAAVEKMNDWYINVSHTTDPKLVNLKNEILDKLHHLRNIEQKLSDLVLLKSSPEWLDILGMSVSTILDPDGWDRKNFEKSWNEKITKEEFLKRYQKSTVYLTTPYHVKMHNEIESRIQTLLP